MGFRSKQRMITSKPKVVIIVLNWNGKDNTIECIKSLNNLIYSNYEIVVVDNASIDGSQESIKENFPGVTLILNRENLGFGGGLNCGIVEALKRDADYVLCLNNDVVLKADLVTELVKIGELNKKIAGLCPIEYLYDEPNRINYAGGQIRFPRGKVFGHGELDQGQYHKVEATGLLCGPAMMLKTKPLLDIGFFKLKYFYGQEDLDIALRFIKKGYKLVFVPSAKLWHKCRGATGGKISPLNVYFIIRNELLFAKEHSKKFELLGSALFFGLFTFPFFIAKVLLRGDVQSFDAAIMGLMWNISNSSVPSDPEVVKLLSRVAN